MENDEKVLSEFFAKPKLVDGTGKEITKEDMEKINNLRKENLNKMKEYIEKNKNDEMFSDIPRKSR